MTTQASQLPQRAEKLSFPISIRWSDQDPNGHVNNARILTLIEEARVLAGIQWWGGTPNQDPPRVVRAMNVDYRGAVHYGPESRVDVWISRIGNTSYSVTHELFQDGESCVLARAIIVILDSKTGQPLAVPESIRQVLQANLVDG